MKAFSQMNNNELCELKKELENLCINSKKVKEYKASAKDFILKRYNWDKVVEATLDLYKKEKVN